MSLPIEDYALIGNLHTAALVGKNGAIDWLCLPRFDSAACFSSLLGTQENGYWSIAPSVPYTVTRRYRPKTLILETTFKTAHGMVTLVDCMLPAGPDADLVRMVRGDEGEVPMRAELRIRFDYGSVIPWMSYFPEEVMAIAGPDMLHLYCPAAHAQIRFTGGNDQTEARFTVRKGQTVPFVMNWHASYERRLDRIEKPEDSIDATDRWWKEWSGRSTYGGEWPELVERSLITLKALTFAPSGGIVAAATTSLPEQVGGVRNWDYRYCWLRDATFTLYALMTTGHVEEAWAWRDWLLRAVAGMPERVQIMYDLRGARRLREYSLEWLAGYERSKPVRVGNAAATQLQLDVIGELMDSFHVSRKAGLEPDPMAWKLQQNLLKYLESVWNLPDQGIWEVRGPRRHFTHSKVMAWVALDRCIKAVERFGLNGPVEQWKKLAGAIRQEVLSKGFNSKKNSFVQCYGSDRLDGSLLMLPLVGFIDVHDPRMLGTIRAIERELMEQGFVLRYRPDGGQLDGLPGTEGVFLACSSWLADNYALSGRVKDARELFERIAATGNDVGLFAEQYDPISKRQLGNFPQAFTHVGLVNTARNVSIQEGGPAYDRRAA